MGFEYKNRLSNKVLIKAKPNVKFNSNALN
jgi:hypothetical protein